MGGNPTRMGTADRPACRQTGLKGRDAEGKLFGMTRGIMAHGHLRGWGDGRRRDRAADAE